MYAILYNKCLTMTIETQHKKYVLMQLKYQYACSTCVTIFHLQKLY